MEQAIERLIQLTTTDEHLHNEAIALKARFNKLKREQNMGVISNSDAQIESNRITKSLLDLAAEIPAGGTSGTPPKEPVQETTPHNSGGPPPAHNTTFPWLVGIGAFLLILVLLMFVPCPTGPQFFAFRIVLALATAILASQLPGMFQFEMPPVVKAGGALAIFAALYFTNPAKLVGEGKCASGPFEFTVQLKPSPELNIPNTYPGFDTTAVVELYLDNYRKPNDAIKDGLADFKSIPANKRDQTVPVRLKARYWKLASDSITLIGKSQIALIEPDGSLAAIEGKVMDNKTGDPVPDAVVEALGLTDTTNAQGNFRLVIPLKKQRSEYEVYVTKPGYGAWKGRATPATGASLEVLIGKNGK